MSKCSYPQHHKSASSGPGVLGLLVVMAAVVYAAVRLVLAVVAFISAWWWVFVVASAVLVVVVLLSRPGWLRHSPGAGRAAVGWRHTSRNLGLAYADKHRPGKIVRPRARIRPGAQARWRRSVPRPVSAVPSWTPPPSISPTAGSARGCLCLSRSPAGWSSAGSSVIRCSSGCPPRSCPRSTAGTCPGP